VKYKVSGRGSESVNIVLLKIPCAMCVQPFSGRYNFGTRGQSTLLHQKLTFWSKVIIYGFGAAVKFHFLVFKFTVRHIDWLTRKTTPLIVLLLFIMDTDVS
jgi:hypothetical protein